PVLGVALLGQPHRADHISEQHRHLLALALQGAAPGADLLGQVLWGGRGDWRRGDGERLAAAVAVLGCWGIGRAAGGARDRVDQGRRALGAKTRPLTILLAAGRAVHGVGLRAITLGGLAALAVVAFREQSDWRKGIRSRRKAARGGR